MIKITKIKKDKLAFIIALGTNLLLIWTNLAVGIIGSENNPINRLFFIIPVIFLLGLIISKKETKKLAFTLNLMALGQFLIPFLALIINRPPFNLGIVLVIIFNSFFVVAFWLAAQLFKKAK